MVSSSIIGVGLSIASAVLGAANRSLLSRPLMHVSARFVTLLTSIIGLAVSLVAVVGSGQVQSFSLISWYPLIIFSLVGIFNFGVARVLVYYSIRNMGANQTAAFQPTTILFSLAMSVMFLREGLSILTLGGALLIVAGGFMAEGRLGAQTRGGRALVGVSSVLLGSFFYGLAFVLIKLGLDIYSFPLAGTFFAYLATVPFAASTYRPGNTKDDRKKATKALLGIIAVSATFIVLSQMARFAAVTYLPVVIVAPIAATSPFYVVIFTRFLAKDIEVFQPRTLYSILCAVVGTVVVSYSSGLV